MQPSSGITLIAIIMPIGLLVLCSSFHRHQTGKVKLIFRSDPAVARKTVDQFEIWNGQPVIHDAELVDKPKN